jgi:hypothetical protein
MGHFMGPLHVGHGLERLGRHVSVLAGMMGITEALYLPAAGGLIAASHPGGRVLAVFEAGDDAIRFLDQNRGRQNCGNGRDQGDEFRWSLGLTGGMNLKPVPAGNGWKRYFAASFSSMSTPIRGASLRYIYPFFICGQPGKTS